MDVTRPIAYIGLQEALDSLLAAGKYSYGRYTLPGEESPIDSSDHDRWTFNGDSGFSDSVSENTKACIRAIENDTYIPEEKPKKKRGRYGKYPEQGSEVTDTENEQ